MKKFFLVTTIAFFCFKLSTIEARQHVNQVIPPYQMQNYDADINRLYQTIPESHHANIANRVAAISKFFLGKPYFLGALGEGAQGQFDQNPLYRTDKFDCLTYVSTVLALSHANNLQAFKQKILRVRYQNANPTFRSRNHFTSIDWNKNNSYQGYIQNVTYKIINRAGKPVAKVASTIINKPAWYKAMSANQIKLLHPSNKPENLLKKLHQEAKYVQQEKSVILYIPLNKLFDKKGQPNNYLFQQIPNGSIIEIIRPNWQLSKKIGTNLNVSHLGLAIKTKQGLIYREASLIKNKVIDIPLANYLKKYISSKTVKGITILKIT